MARPILTIHGLRPRPEPAPTPAPATPKRPHPRTDLKSLAEAFTGIDLATPKPLAIGSHAEALKTCTAQLGWSNNRTRAVLAYYTGSLRYLWATVEDTHRINLDGTEAQPIAEADRVHAKTRLAAINGRGKDQ